MESSMHPIKRVSLLFLTFLILAAEARADFLWFRRRGAEGQAVIALPPEELRRIGQQIWRNECGGTVEGLTSWNRNENFASLGIGHFIWYPAGVEGPFDESWPKLLNFLRVKGVALPAWLLGRPDCPWRSYGEFHAAQGDPAMQELRALLSRTVDLQTEFIVHRLRAALPKMTEAPGLNRASRRHLESRFHALAGSGQGLYALIDYVNFKGEGTKPEERYRGQGWGLAQVLLEMQGEPQGAAAAWEFSESAKRVLARRVQNAPRDESQWLQGWLNRCESYKRPL